ncbi:arylsulfatase [Tropicimonas marinistellae]|uniref:arylsulfatase n=1 Tax=Tropicimonas marinistellae TaxID=1739787 RepID=UPI000A49B33B|nr:arylsulfatase [Tropicimonas marinistellae]
MKLHGHLRNLRAVLAGCIAASGLAATVQAQEMPNVLVIMGDDIGYWNISKYNMGMMGYRTPNIDRIADEGMAFTDAYGEQSCTAGRAAFITGQLPVRTGLTKVGLPGAELGMRPEDPTLAEYLKSKGYVTGQFGKNHFGDRDEHLPTNHGFDEFFGNLYHLNAEEEPENPDYPKDPAFRQQFGPRGVIKASADGDIQDTGPLSRKRMETVDEEFLAAALDFMDRAVEQETPFFTWFNTSRMHVWTHLKPESDGVTGLGLYPDGMVEHDGHVGQILGKLDELGVADNTIVIYTTDNGVEKFGWPDGGTAPFRSEKNSNWEGGFRVPLLVKWPGVIEPGSISNDIISHKDWFPTIAEGLGDADLKERMREGPVFGGDNTAVYLDGYSFYKRFKGEMDEPPRNEFFYFSDGGDLMNLRYNQFKIVFAEQLTEGVSVWRYPLVELRFPKIFNLRSNPFELDADIAIGLHRWNVERMFVMQPAMAFIQEKLATFQEFPPRQEPESWTLGDVMETIRATAGNH